MVFAGLSAAAGCSDEVEIAAGLDARQANRVLVHLAAEVESARCAQSRTNTLAYAVRVAPADEARARALIERLDLLEGPDTLSAEFDDGVLIPSATADRARLMAGLGRSLGDTLEQVDGVLRARVHVMLPESDNLTLTGRHVGTPTASVLLLCDAEQPDGVQPIDEQDVKRLIAGAVENLPPERIDVIYTVAAPRSVPPRNDLTQRASNTPPLSQQTLVVAFLTVIGALSLTVAVLSLRRRNPNV